MTRLKPGALVELTAETNAVGAGGHLGWMNPGTRLRVVADDYVRDVPSRPVKVNSEEFGLVQVVARLLRPV